MKHRNAIVAVAIGSLAVALLAVNTIATPRSKRLHLLSESTPKSVHSGLHSQAPTIETTGFEVPDWDAYNPAAICNSGANAGLACTGPGDCPGGTCDVDNFFCGAGYRGFCKATPIAGSCTGVPSADVNCCIGAPNVLNGWFASGSSQHCRQPHIEIAHPSTGSQHLRFVRDPLAGNPAGCVGLNTACRENAFTPDMGPAQPVGRTTISWDISESSSFGQTLQYFTVGADGGTGTILYFTNGGNIYVYDAAIGGQAGLINAGPFDYSGPYHPFKIVKDPCANTLTYFYDNAQIYQTAATSETLTVERAIIETDNAAGPLGDHFVDIDNYSVVREGPCPTICGANGVEPGEQCDPSAPDVGCPAARCIPPGQPGECTCTPICTLNDPCILHNGANGPFISPCDPQFACIFLYTATTESVEIDTCGTTGGDTQIFYWGSITDPNDPGSNNDDCENTDQFGAGSDPNASCYNNPGPFFNSCTCHDNPTAGDNGFLAQIGANGGVPPLGVSMIINVEKKAGACGTSAVVGSCCDSNGADFGCTDDVPQSACVGPDKHWSTAKCAGVTCTCIPSCAGVICGTDGCGGNCPDLCSNGNVCDGTETCNFSMGQCVAGTPLNCNDGNACNGVETCDPVNGCQPGTPLSCDDHNACNGVETCNPASGCVAGTPLNCDDGNACNGVETCNAASGCVAGTPVNCDDGVDCTVDSCDPATGACSHDQSGCFTPIPTVSQWGIAVMALLLLIGAKIYFSRRQSTTA